MTPAKRSYCALLNRALPIFPGVAAAAQGEKCNKKPDPCPRWVGLFWTGLGFGFWGCQPEFERLRKVQQSPPFVRKTDQASRPGTSGNTPRWISIHGGGGYWLVRTAHW